MKIGFVVHFFDFRNDVRRLITEVSKKHEVVLFVNQNQLDIIKNHQLLNTTIRVINEKKISKKNKILELLFYFFKKIPKSKSNFFLMESFKIGNIKDVTKQKKSKQKFKHGYEITESYFI